MYSLVLSGCCSNVYFLEVLVRKHPELGELLTFAQFLFITVASISHFRFSKSWILPSLVYGLVNFLNNYVWAYKISVPVHTIIRSSGPLVSLVIGTLLGKTYTRKQMSGVAVICLGVTVSASGSIGSSNPTGIVILSLATVMASVQSFLTAGVTSEWQESLCMSHSLSIPFFWFTREKIAAQLSSLNSKDMAWLAANCASQYVCAVGVNKLVTEKGPVALNVTLTVRKFVSLALSALLFGGVPGPVLLGGALVGLGAIIYG